MRRGLLNLPRPIRPELVELGDEIEVTLPKAAGMTVTRRGVVYERMDQGNVRRFLTSEGGVLIAWEPGTNKATVTLHKRADPPAEALFDFESAMDEVRKRAV